MGETDLLKQEEAKTYINSDGIISINSSFEPDIIERFTKAIEHYKTLMTVKKSTETF